MGEFARTLQATLHDHLTDRIDGFEWREEYDVAGTPVDVAGVSDDVLVAVELEVRRADPANNTVALLRNLDDGPLAAYEHVVVCQVFSTYYDLVSGDVSTKRKNATYVGRLAERAYDGVTFHAVDLPVEPPKRGDSPPSSWEAGVDAAAKTVHAAVDDATRSPR